MKKLIVFILIVFVIKDTYGQVISNDKFNEERIQTVRRSMLVLGAWGAANLIYSGASFSSATGSNKYFYQMNLVWGGVNFTLGTIGYFFTKNKYGLSYSESVKKQMVLEKVFLFNAGLDVAYLAGGFYLKERSKANLTNSDRNKGYGQSIILQGSALLLFDGIMFLVHQNHGRKLYKLADKIKIGASLNRVECIVKL